MLLLKVLQAKLQPTRASLKDLEFDMASTIFETNRSLAEAYADKSLSYFQSARQDIIADLPRSPHRILEIGCGTGATLALAKREKKAGLTAGVEIEPASATTAREHVDMVVEGNIESVELPFPP